MKMLGKPSAGLMPGGPKNPKSAGFVRGTQTFLAGEDIFIVLA